MTRYGLAKYFHSCYSGTVKLWLIKFKAVQEYIFIHPLSLQLCYVNVLMIFRTNLVNIEAVSQPYYIYFGCIGRHIIDF